MLYKTLNATVTDVDPVKGITTGYLSNWNNKDSDGDYTVKGKTFVKTVTESGPAGKGSIQYLLNHKWETPAGVFTSIKEDSVGMPYESQLTKSKAGIFTPRSEEIIALHDTGYKFNHSYGYKVLNAQKTADGNMLTEVKLFEGSILYGPGANPLTPLTGLKSANGEPIEDVLELLYVYEKMLHSGNWQEDTYRSIQEKHDVIDALIKAKLATEPGKTTQPEPVDYSAFADQIKSHFSFQ